MMNKKSIRALVVEDSIDDFDLLLINLQQSGFEITAERVDNAQSMRKCLSQADWDIIIADHSLPKFSADAALKLLKETGLDIPLVIVSGVIGEDAAVMAMRAGASDYIGKSSLARLAPVIEREIAEREVRRATRKAEETYNLEKKAAEEERERLYRQSELANRMKDEFLATLSHELRTPLHVIIGNLQILNEFKQGTPEFEQSLDAMKRNTNAQLRIVNDLLDTSRIISGKIALKPEELDARTLVSGVVQSHRIAFEAKNISVELDFAKDRLLVFGDNDRLQQVIWNLLSNAIKFTPSGGWCKISVKLSKSGVEIIVQDSGKGMDPESLPIVFERFRQEDGSTTRAYGGLGLGLAIARHIVEMHGGTIRAESDGPGKGAAFFVNLPLAQSADTRILQDDFSKSMGRSVKPLEGIRVLSVDDQIDARIMMENFLRAEGAEVISASSTDEALNQVRSKPFDILIADIGMPGKDGHFLIKEIRNGMPADRSRLPAIALTAYASEKDRNEAIRSGYDQHITKPIGQAALVTEISKLLM
ncbi:MAG: response regulator [Oligoflexales bacterium]